MPVSTKEIKMSAKALRDFGVEYSKSSRANCCGCRQKIAKAIVRVKKVVYTTEVGINFGGQPLWHHLECFAQVIFYKFVNRFQKSDLNDVFSLRLNWDGMVAEINCPVSNSLPVKIKSWFCQ